MSIDLKLKGGDLAIVDGDFLLFGGAEQIAQQVAITLQTFKGEWFLDDEHGVPYLDKILTKAPNRAEVEAILRAAIKAVPGVTAVPDLKLFINHPARKLKVSFQAETTEGLEKIEVTI